MFSSSVEKGLVGHSRKRLAERHPTLLLPRVFAEGILEKSEDISILQSICLKSCVEDVPALKLVNTKTKIKNKNLLKVQWLRICGNAAQLKNSTMVTSQQHTLYAGQKVLESRKADNVTVNADKSLRLLLVSAPFRKHVYQKKHMSSFYLL